MAAPSKAEPLPPPGIALDPFLDAMAAAFGEERARAFDEWLRVTYPAWAREGWTRLDTARKSCDGR